MKASSIFGTGLIFLPQYEYEAILCMEVLTKYIRQEGLELIEYYDMEINSPALKNITQAGESHIAQVLIKSDLDKKEFEKKLSLVFNEAAHQIHKSKLKHREEFSAGTLSTRVA